MSSEAPLIEPKRKLFFGLFIFPLVITVGMGVFLCAAVLMTHEQDTPENLIASLKRSSPAKRWQKAFELSNELNRDTKRYDNEAVMSEIISIFSDSVHYDTKTRSYMALALGRFDAPQASEALVKGTQDASEEVRVHATWALSSIQHKNASNTLRLLLKDDSEHVRKLAAYALGSQACLDCIPDLRPLLKDGSADVRWNTALALARLGDDSGADILAQMLERDLLASQYKMDETAIESVMINALKGLGLIKNANSARILQSVSKNDKNVHVRQAALAALENINKI